MQILLRTLITCGIILPTVLSAPEISSLVDLLVSENSDMTLEENSRTTIRVCNRTAEPYRQHDHRFFNSKRHIYRKIEDMPQYINNNCTEVLQSTNFPQNNTQFRRNGLVNTVVDAYSGHHNLVLRPDDVWAAIMTQFSFYVNKNAEEFRGKFVNFEGKKELKVGTAGSLRTVSYRKLVKLMSAEIDRNLVDSEVKEWVLPNFSTTTDNDRVSTGVVLMATFKKYFQYTFELRCGIPNIMLEGTEEDWVNVQERLNKLKEYGLEKWYNMLEPIVKQFVEAKKGNADRKFWGKIVSHREGSGVSYISGWITAFCVFDEEGNWRKEKPRDAKVPTKGDWIVVDTADIPSGVAEVDVKIDDNGVTYDSVLFGGHMATEITGDMDNTIQPTLGWVMALK